MIPETIVATPTRGEFRVVDIATDGSLSADEALRIAAEVERDSEHTIAQGIVKSAEEKNLSVPKADQFEAIPGHGVKAVVEGREFYMGGHRRDRHWRPAFWLARGFCSRLPSRPS